MKNCIIVRGGGDLASGVINSLALCGFPIIVTETEYPSVIRRSVSYATAVYEHAITIDDVTARFIGKFSAENYQKIMHEIYQSFETKSIPIIIDPKLTLLHYCNEFNINPIIIIDAIMAKKNLGTNKNMAPITIALGPGFTAGVDTNADVDAVIETMRGHDLARIIYNGKALANTGVPGLIGGVDKDRVLHAPCSGIFYAKKKIGEQVSKNEVIAEIINTKKNTHVPVFATINGLLRGIIGDKYEVTQGLKIADIDPRITEKNNCFTISDKSRTIGNAVLQAVIVLSQKRGVQWF